MIKNMEWGAVAGSSSSTTCNAYNTANGLLASTTGNIYGVYDMSGGSNEYVMANIVNAKGEFFISSAFENIPDKKYYDSYTYYTSSNNHGRGKLGDATKETLTNLGFIDTVGWYKDSSNFAYSESPWFSRGNNYGNGSSAGIFSYASNNGYNAAYIGSRSVLTLE